MDIRPVKTQADHQDALREIERLWGAEAGTRDGDKLEVLITLVAAYEDQHWPVPDVSPVELLRHAINDMGHSQDELAKLLGSRSRASEILSGGRRLTVQMIDAISSAWLLPAELLVRPYKLNGKVSNPAAQSALSTRRGKRSQRAA